MKELSIEEKAKAYDEAKARMSKAYNDNRCTIGFMNEIFPELKESEDERIRKEIISAVNIYCSEYSRGTKVREDMLAWLEKKGSEPNWCHHKVDLSDCSEEYRKAYYDGWNNCNQQHAQLEAEQKPAFEIKTPEESLGIDSDTYNKIVDECIFGEQKPTDEVKPRFKVGNWVVSPTGVCWHIDRIENNRYEVTSDTGKCADWPLDTDLYHLWTIKDAKPGDVLHATGWHSDCIFIFSGLDNWKFDEPDGEKALATSYCCIHVYSDMIEFGTQGPDCIEVNTVKPATKIQCDLLFRNIRENGYEWDTNALELKKISLNKEDIKPFTIEHGKYYYCIEDYWSGGNKRASKGDVVQALRGMNMMALNSEEAANYFLPVNSIKQKSSEWDEEDEKMFRSLHNIIYAVRDCDCDSKEKKELSDWLKSLKDRFIPQPKQEWSEEDENMLQSILDEYKSMPIEKRNWLKSLRPQSHWKPSERQLDVLKSAISELDAYDDSLTELYNDLKKLKE